MPVYTVYSLCFCGHGVKVPPSNLVSHKKNLRFDPKRRQRKRYFRNSMPYSRKPYPRLPYLSLLLNSSTSICCVLLGSVAFIFGVLAIFRHVPGYRCSSSEPRSVSVSWDVGSGGGLVLSHEGDLVVASEVKRHKVMGFVGIQTGYGSVGRRKSLRKTWLPSDREGLQRLEAATGLAFRFVIGKTSDQSKMSQLRKEVAVYDDFMLLDLEEDYRNLPHKTLAFFKAAYHLFDSEFYVKADDDIYLRPDRLSLLLAKDRSNPRTYLGCMKKGPVFTDPKLKWYEPHSHLLGNQYFLHAYGPIYALSADIVSSLVSLKNNSFRMFSNEDVTIGSWMLAMNVNHEDDRALCAPDCTESSIAVWDIPTCSGLCSPEEKLLTLHQRESCSGNSPLVSNG